jgi:hypothetical protein
VLAFDHAGEGRSAEPIIVGDRGAGAWTLEAVAADGSRTPVEGSDLFEFVGDRIKVKDAYRKVHADPHDH